MARTSPTPIIRRLILKIDTDERNPTMTELARPAAAEAAPLVYSDLIKTQAEQRAELRRMRTIATMLLVLMAAIYLLMRRAPPSWAWAPYLGAFAEAGMVGACADWFAVVALFRRPLGLPIPHTAVVPENKRRIGPALGRFITNNFLSPRVAIARLVVGRLRSVSRRDGSKTSATRGRSRPAPDGSSRMRSTWCRKRRSRSGSLLPRGAGSRRSPLRRSPRGVWRSCGLREPARRCSIRASISSRRRSSATRRRSSGTCRRSPRAGSPNGSTT